MHRRYKDQVAFLAVYVREAHPTDGWRMESNDRAGISFKQPTTARESVGIVMVVIGVALLVLAH